MYLKRKIDKYLLNWKNENDHLPLLVRGTRQIGKTAAIRKLAKENYNYTVEINFYEEPKYKKICEDGYSSHTIIQNISRLNPMVKFEPSQTLIFFDEIQEFPEISTALKFFAEDGRYDVICSGSLLGLFYKRIESNSVGYKTDYDMKAMDFEEFLWAKGYDESIAADLLEHMLELKPFSDLYMDLFNNLFVDYCILGGMPAVVARYIERNTFEGTLRMQRQLVRDYQEDIRKYAEGMDQAKILNVYNQVPVQLSKENKKFQFSMISSGARYRDYWGCVDWLEQAGVINICRCMHFPSLPLKGNYEETKFKLYMSDTGLLVSLLDDEVQQDLRANKNLGIYKGALYENFVGEGLVKQGYDLCYYKRENSTLEEDFFLRTARSLIPIEVKAKNGTAKSLRTLIQSDSYPDITNGIKLTGGNIGFKNDIYTFPYFCTFLMKRYLAEVEY